MNRLVTRIAAPALAALALSATLITGVAAQTPATAPSAPAAVPAAVAAPASGDAVRGKSSFMKFGCYECHGTVGQGNYFSGVRLAPHPLPLGAVINYIRRPAGQMPSYSAAILPDKDVADIWAYLASIPPTKPAAQIPILNSTTLKPK